MQAIEAGPITEEEFDALIAAGDYEREPELIDGYVEWRDAEVPTKVHAAWMTAIVLWFGNHRDEWSINVYAELRTKPAIGSSLLPDVLILSLDAPDEQIVTHAPLAVFEILSPRQSMTVLKAKFLRYEQMGIQQIWFIDPAKGVWQQYASGRLLETEDFPGIQTIPPFSMREISRLVR